MPATGLDSRLRALTLRDERRLRRDLERAQGETTEEIARRIDEAEARVERRRASVPHATYPAELPITDRREELLETIAAHQVVIVAGETGSGKSTQLPKLCLELGRGVRGMIGHTQPRRLAARTIAERVAEEVGSHVGGSVGYTVRFTDRVSEDTLVKVMTDGILLNEIQRDRTLTQYDTLIIDEAHERGLNIDFILGYLKQLLPRRPDLKVIVTSATIDTEKFSKHFDGAPVVEVSGRTYPVEVRYRPLDDDEAETDDRDQIQGICDAVEELCREGPGDILVFLSGEREIRDTADAVAGMKLIDTEIVPLYARLSAAEQHRVFQPHGGRRIVLATNVAETSLTVPGIRCVVDAGTARISRYSRRTKVQRLPIEPISQAAANQRAGRCGRVAPGICIRLYGEDEFLTRPEFTEPEILRTNLASVILQMAAIGLGDIAAFPFVDPPDARNIKDGIVLLEELGAFDMTNREVRKRLTAVGRKLAQLPLDPRLGRMILEADRNGCVREVMIISAALSIQDPRERPMGKQEAADEQHRRFADPESDFVSLLNLWEYLRERQRELSSSQFRKLCRNEYFNYLRVREWHDIFSQLRQASSGLGIHLNTEPAQRDAIHISLLAGLLSHIGVRGDAVKDDYLGARNARFALTPGSALFRKPPRWVMAAELVETTRLWARVVARIQPEWAERLAPHLVRRSYSEPQWDADRGAAMALERVTLYGVPIVAARRVNYGRVDPVGARELFIQHALVEGEWNTHHRFIADNQRMLEEVERLESRVRRRDILVDDATLHDFFDRRIPREVVSAAHFDRWWKATKQEHPSLLTFTLDDLIDPGAGTIDLDEYPATWQQGDITLALSYAFAPGTDDDGVAVHIPLALLNRVTSDGFDWHIPALREELVTELIRSLPKSLRRNFIPAPDYARSFLRDAKPGEGPLLAALAESLGRMTGVAIPPGSWQVDQLPPHLTMSYIVEDDGGQAIASCKDLGALRGQLRGRLRAAIADAAGLIERSGLTEWTIGAIPRVIETARGDHVVRAFPALVDEGDTVGLRLFESAAEQARAMWAGTRRLLQLTAASPVVAAQRRLSNAAKLALAHAPGQTVTEVLDECARAALDAILVERGGPAWDAEGFDVLRRDSRDRLADMTLATATKVAKVVGSARSIEGRLDAIHAPALGPALDDISRQLARLVYPGFISATGAGRFDDVMRYLAAIEHRLTKLGRDVGRDREHMRRVQRVEAEYDRLVDLLPPERWPALQEARWLIEELRVNLFAQSIGSTVRVSEERILKMLASVAA